MRAIYRYTSRQVSNYCMKSKPEKIIAAWAMIAAFLVNVGFAQVRINEVMADNGGTVEAPGGGSPDYIELVNTGASATNIGGWKLTDTTSSSDSNLFVFPTGTVIPCRRLFDGVA
jgi:hypothetical protein